MTRWNVHIALDVLGDVIHWSLNDEALSELRQAIAAGDLGRARIVRVEPERSERPAAAAA
ncbi:MAG: hypothetical protein KGJ86_08100 [Chloroflexota bacterium]|nr:hypothetical protein [Chloroflexota bacterium]